VTCHVAIVGNRVLATEEDIAVGVNEQRSEWSVAVVSGTTSYVERLAHHLLVTVVHGGPSS